MSHVFFRNLVKSDHKILRELNYCFIPVKATYLIIPDIDCTVQQQNPSELRYKGSSDFTCNFPEDGIVFAQRN